MPPALADSVRQGIHLKTDAGKCLSAAFFPFIIFLFPCLHILHPNLFVKLIEFLNYVEDSTDEAAKEIKSERVKRIHNQVCKVKLNEEIGVKYMQAWEEKYYEREEGKEEGRLMTLVNQVCRKLTKGMNAVDIADMLEEEEGVIQDICNAAKQYAPDYDVESITDALLGNADLRI